MTGRLIFGKGKFKFYVKGAMVFIGERIFLNVEYELAYMSNSDYTNGLMNTANLGLGFKF